ncbi:MAG: tRNA (adenosine(37)-N6)-threonylcarbamoyltransferase complex dimerization subunit type 1 TsaB [Jhaorihella sp.]
MSEPLILAFDTSAAHCAAALLSGGRIVTSAAEAMSRGQAERLMTLLGEVLSGCGHDWRDLDAIGVGIGPGNFTGIRISVSAARGLALGLGVPAYGVDGFAARRLIAPGLVATVPATQGRLYVDMGAAQPALMPFEDVGEHAARLGIGIAPQPDPAQLAVAIARLAGERWPDPAPAPAPLYIRPADAAPQREAPPVLLD